MRNQFLLLAAGAMLFVASCKKSDNHECDAKPATANTEATSKTAGQPFKGTMTYAFGTEANLPCECGSFFPIGTLSGTGNITHLGNATSLIKPCVQPLMHNGQQIGDHVGVECGSFVAANGDELFCHTYPYNLMYTATAAVGTITCDFVGGTGKFKNATGSFTGTITVPYGQGVANFTNIDGIIKY